MWHYVPNSFIQSRALFRDGELPLWHRYNSCGLRLLGPRTVNVRRSLHGIVLFASGAAWAWDLKFILAKILFAFGIGHCGTLRAVSCARGQVYARRPG